MNYTDPPRGTCTRPPQGWWCSLREGHDGPCPTRTESFHEVSDDCPCGPTSEPIKREDGSVGWVIVHHSLDGREFREASSICPHPAPTNLCRACEVKRRAERLRAQGVEVRDA